jgi:hypothetical protein
LRPAYGLGMNLAVTGLSMTICLVASAYLAVNRHR